MLVKCLYCDAANDGLSTGAYCETCGKKLPTSAMTRPRRTLGGDLPGEPGESMPASHAARPVSEALFATAVVHLFAGGAFFILALPLCGWLLPGAFERLKEQSFGPTVLSWTLWPALALAVLGLAARWVPTPAVAVAALLAVAWVPLSFLLHPSLALGWLAVDAALFAMLGWALLRVLQAQGRPGG